MHQKPKHEGAEEQQQKNLLLLNATDLVPVKMIDGLSLYVAAYCLE